MKKLIIAITAFASLSATANDFVSESIDRAYGYDNVTTVKCMKSDTYFEIEISEHNPSRVEHGEIVHEVNVSTFENFNDFRAGLNKTIVASEDVPPEGERLGMEPSSPTVLTYYVSYDSEDHLKLSLIDEKYVKGQYFQTDLGKGHTKDLLCNVESVETR